jgi:hypothetical protein
VTTERLGLVIGFIEHLQNVTRNNYGSLTGLHIPNITATTAHIKSSLSSLALDCWWLSQLQLSTVSTTQSHSQSHFTTGGLPSPSPSHIATDGQSVSKSWYRAPSWGPWPDIYCSSTLTVLFLLGAFSDERMGLSFIYAAGRCQRRWFTANHSSLGTAPARTAQETSLPILRLLSLPGKHLSTELFPSNDCCTVDSLHSWYLAMGLHGTILTTVLSRLNGNEYAWGAHTMRTALSCTSPSICDSGSLRSPLQRLTALSIYRTNSSYCTVLSLPESCSVER